MDVRPGIDPEWALMCVTLAAIGGLGVAVYWVTRILERLHAAERAADRANHAHDLVLADYRAQSEAWETDMEAWRATTANHHGGAHD